MVVDIIAHAVAAEVAHAVGELVTEGAADVDRRFGIEVGVSAGPSAEGRVDVDVGVVEVGLLSHEIHVATRTFALRAVDGGTWPLDDVQGSNAIEARRRAVAGEKG